MVSYCIKWQDLGVGIDQCNRTKNTFIYYNKKKSLDLLRENMNYLTSGEKTLVS